MENEKKRFHITITDNKTGEVITDTDTAAIIGAHDADDEGTAKICLTSCSSDSLICTIAGVYGVIAQIKKDHPVPVVLAELLSKEDIKGAEAEPDEE